MVELNSTIFPILGPIGTFVNTVKVFVGGVFGVYLIILYIRWREYSLLRRMYRELKSDLQAIAEKENVKLPETESRIKTFGDHLKEKLKRTRKSGTKKR